MKNLPLLLLAGLILLGFTQSLSGQNNYFFPKIESFDNDIPSPQEFLGYAIGEQHTRHDQTAHLCQCHSDSKFDAVDPSPIQS